MPHGGRKNCGDERLYLRDDVLRAGLLAGLNGLGQAILLIMSAWQSWQIGHSAIVVTCALILNATLLDPPASRTLMTLKLRLRSKALWFMDSKVC
jgi:hypothetical protein